MAKVYFLRIDGELAEVGSKGQLLDSIKERFGICTTVDELSYVAPTGEQIKIDEQSSSDFYVKVV